MYKQGGCAQDVKEMEEVQVEHSWSKWDEVEYFWIGQDSNQRDRSVPWNLNEEDSQVRERGRFYPVKDGSWQPKGMGTSLWAGPLLLWCLSKSKS